MSRPAFRFTSSFKKVHPIKRIGSVLVKILAVVGAVLGALHIINKTTKSEIKSKTK